ncbi:MAG: M61 family metallopeptidase [bacterium]|nr:M61 family metallopeptidase [bacterium]
MRRAIVSAVIWFGIIGTATTQQPMRYEVSSPNPASHLLHVRVTVPAEYGCPDLSFAAWTPGGYLINHHAGRVLDAHFSASDGHALPTSRRDLDTWHVNCNSTQGYSAEFRLYSVAAKNPYSAHIDDRLLFANLVTVLPHITSHRDAPAQLVIRPPDGWRAVCSLPPMADRSLTYQAEDWDHLADAIFAAAPNLTVVPFSVEKAQLSIAFTEAPGAEVDLAEVARVHQALTRSASRTFAGLPFDRYLFLYKVGPSGSRGGLEHSEGTAMGCPGESIETTDGLLELMELAAHELVHAWNVKRARPRSLTPYDYTRTQLTELLWVAEGWTSYYAPLLLVRAGLTTREELYQALADRVNHQRANPTNRFRSLNDISRESWLRSTVPFFTFRTYYNKGAVSGMDLDLRLRDAGASEGLDDLMRVLLSDPDLRHRGYTLADLKFHAGRLASQPLEDWFRDVAETPGYLDISESLMTMGLRIDVDQDRLSAGFTGISLDDDTSDARIRWIEPDSPGARAGLGAGDTLLAIDGVPGSTDELEEMLRLLQPSVAARLQIRRRDRVMAVEIHPIQPPADRVPIRIVEVAQPTDEQRAARDAWLWRLE